VPLLSATPPLNVFAALKVKGPLPDLARIPLLLRTLVTDKPAPLMLNVFVPLSAMGRPTEQLVVAVESTVTPLVSVIALPASAKLPAANSIDANDMPVRSLLLLVFVVPEKMSADPLVGAMPVDQFAPVLQLLLLPPPVHVTLNS
jgi:hypothetical protein